MINLHFLIENPASTWIGIMFILTDVWFEMSTLYPKTNTRLFYPYNFLVLFPTVIPRLANHQMLLLNPIQN